MSDPDSHLIRILIVDDHPIVREGLSSLLSKQPDFKVCGEAADVQAALKLVTDADPHVVTVDLSLQSGSGLELIRRISKIDPSICQIVCSLHDEILYAERALNAGALGFVNKLEATGTIVKAIREVFERRVYLSERMSARLAQHMTGAVRQQKRQGIESFSERELEVFQLIGQGSTTSEIAVRLKIGVKTVETHRRRIKKKLAIKNTAQLAREATQWILGNC
jgi:DNA-binding NarL/FixJ family response regulator